MTDVWRYTDLTAWKHHGRPDLPLVAGPASDEQPSGVEFARWQDTYVTGDKTIMDVARRVSGGKYLSLPPGDDFWLTDNFAEGYMDGARFGNGGANGCNGLWGSGRDTIIRMARSNRPNVVSGSPITNNYFMIALNGDAWTGPTKRPNLALGNFSLLGGTYDGDHSFNGLRAENIHDFVIRGVYIKGIRGHDKVPPGETGSISIQRTTGGDIEDIEIDGRRVLDNTLCSSALVMPNNGTGLRIRRAYLHDTLTGGGGIAWYRWDGGYAEDVRTAAIGRDFGGVNSGYGFNHEQANNIEYLRPVWERTKGLHMSFNSDRNVGGAVDNTMIIRDPKWDALTYGSGKLFTDVWNLDGSNTTPPFNQIQRKAPRIYDANGNLNQSLGFFNLPAKYAPAL